MNLFKLFGEIAINSSVADQTIDATMGKVDGLKSSLENTSTQADKTGTKLGAGSKLNSGAVFLGNVYTKLAGYISKVPGMMVRASADVDAKNAAFVSTFGDMADNAKQMYKTVGQETNILETRLRSVGTKGFAQLKGAGLEAADALVQSEKLLRLAADAAAYYDISLESADERIRSFMRGNVEAGDAIGLFTSENQRNAAALEMYESKWVDLTEAERQFLMLDIANGIYEQSGVVGQATRESAEYANVTANAAEAGTQALATLGGRMKESMLPFLDQLSHWLANDETQKKLTAFADSLGKIASFTFDNATALLEWVVDNSDSVTVALGAISTALIVGAVAAHPYAAAITAVAAALALIGGGHNYDQEFFGKYTQEDLDVLQKYVDAKNKLNELEAKASYTNDWRVLMDYSDAQLAYNEAAKQAGAIEGLLGAYQSWLVTQGHTADMPYLNVPVQIAEDAESTIQSGLNGLSLEATVNLVPDYSMIRNAASIAGVSMDGSGENVQGMPTWNAEGAIFSKPTIFNTRLGLQGVGDGRSPEAVAPIDKLQEYVSDAVSKTVGGMQFNVVLDSGVLVGQLAPKMDAKLGTISGRKGRGN
jgi:hypothetical protein